ncbi:MAG: carbohydrate ABC transporter permease [Clostridiales bacterium]|jgi:putative aldouronate transport system permease protein|nr:carbohydrate ABC transporter permease [Clostridiales bacterium]
MAATNGYTQAAGPKPSRAFRRGAVGRKGADIPMIAMVVFLSAWALIILFPFYNAVLISFAPQRVYIRTPLLVYPIEPTLDAYRFVFKWPSLATGLRNTSFILVVGTTYNVLLTALTAYALTKPIPGRKFFRLMILFTMFFGGGLFPYYLFINSTIHLGNTIWAMILPTGISIMDLLIMQSYYETLPEEIAESARIDGAGELKTLFRIVLPMCKPMLATITLYCAVARWNEWWYGMLFERSTDNYPMMLFLRNMLAETRAVTANIPISQRELVFSKGIQMAAIIVTMAPIVCVYPFLQKYFVKGITLGGVKG